MFYMFYSYEKSISRKNTALPIGKFPSLALARIVTMLQHFIIQFPLYYLPSDRLREVKKEILNVRPESGCGRLREVLNIVI